MLPSGDGSDLTEQRYCNQTWIEPIDRVRFIVGLVLPLIGEVLRETVYGDSNLKTDLVSNVDAGIFKLGNRYLLILTEQLRNVST